MLPADDEEQVARRTIRDGGKRVRISTIENRLSRERGGVWRHEERVPREGESDWAEFDLTHAMSSTASATREIDAVGDSLKVEALGEVWTYLKRYSTLKQVAAQIHRGIEWNEPLTVNRQETGARDKFVSRTAKAGFSLGIPPEVKLLSLVVPHLAYLDVREKSQRGGAYKHEWHEPKVFFNSIRSQRKGWRLAAVPDHQGLVGYQNTTAIWPKDMDIDVLAAILSGPVANAFMAAMERDKHNKINVLKRIPIPVVSADRTARIKAHVRAYQTAVDSIFEEILYKREFEVEAAGLLMQIDAEVLAAYDLPPRLERKVLDYLNDSDRPATGDFGDYFPAEFTPYFSFGEYISSAFKAGTAGRLRSDYSAPSEDVRGALELAGDVQDDRQ